MGDPGFRVRDEHKERVRRDFYRRQANRLMLLLALGSMLLGCATTHVDRGGFGGAAPVVSDMPGDLRGPRIVFSGTLVAWRLPLGLPSERLWGAQVRWDYGDGSREHHESDRAPWGSLEAQEAPVERFISTSHCYRVPGEYIVTVGLWKADHKLVERRTSLSVRWAPGEGCR